MLLQCRMRSRVPCLLVPSTSLPVLPIYLRLRRAVASLLRVPVNSNSTNKEEEEEEEAEAEAVSSEGPQVR